MDGFALPRRNEHQEPECECILEAMLLDVKVHQLHCGRKNGRTLRSNGGEKLFRSNSWQVQERVSG